VISTIDGYILRELSKTLFAVLLVLALTLTSMGFVHLLDKVALGEINFDVVVPLIGLKITSYMARSVPAALFFSILTVLGRMYRDGEVTALAACGVGTLRIYRGFFYALLPLAAGTAWLALYAQPWAEARSQIIISEQQELAAELVGLQPGRFSEYSYGELVFYFESFDRERSEMRNIFIQNRENRKIGIITAALARHSYDQKSGDHFLTLSDGRRYEGTPGSPELVIAEFETYTLRITESTTQRHGLHTAAKPSSALLASDDARDAAELRERISYPLSLFTLTLIAVPLSRALPRQGVYGRLFIAFLVYFSFLNMHTVSVDWMKNQVTPQWLSIWWVQGALLLMAFAIGMIDSRWVRRMRRRIRSRRWITRQ
jgi:lipopolysaccharide export system permease protein